MRRTPAGRTTALVALAGAGLALALTACGQDDRTPVAQHSDQPSSTESSATASQTREPSGSTATQPTESPSAAADLSWAEVDGPTKDEATVSGKWTLVRSEDGHTIDLRGPSPHTFTAPDGWRYSHALIDGWFAVAVAEDESGTKPDVATVLDLRKGKEQTVDGSSTPPTTTGGAWALAGGILAHATRPGNDYCLATVDLLSHNSYQGPCVGPRHGFSNVVMTPSTTTALTFNAGHPSCRTPSLVQGQSFEPLPGVTKCVGWDSAATESGQVWSVIPNEKRIEQAHFYADFGSGKVDLGPGASGSLVWCGASAYFVRDPQSDSDPARVLRATPDGAEVAFESKGTGSAFMSAPRCGGRQLTVSAFSEAGDQQVMAKVR